MGCCGGKQGPKDGPSACNEITELLKGWTGVSEEKKIIDILRTVDLGALCFCVQNLSLKQLLEDVDNRIWGPDNRTALIELLTVQRLGDLDLRSCAKLAVALSQYAQRLSEQDAKREEKAVARLWGKLPEQERKKLIGDLAPQGHELVKCIATHGCAHGVNLPSLSGPDYDLAQVGTASLPEAVRKAGEQAIDEAAAAVLKSFPSREAPLIGPELEGLLDVMKMQQLRQKLKFDEYPNVGAFVDEVVRVAKLNPILVAFGSAYSKIPPGERQRIGPPAGPDRDRDVRQAVIYCFLLDVMTKKSMYEPKQKEGNFFAEMCRQFEADKDSMPWQQYVTAFFERAKLATVYMPVKGIWLPRKIGEKEEDNESSVGYGLSINILEAMYQDERLGFEDNAAAGFELMMEPFDQDPIKGAGNDIDKEWVLNGTETGVIVYTNPLPTAWNNLYNSWNLAFCMTYRNWPMFFAKLLNPATAGTYHEHEGLYMWPRVVALFIHIHWNLCARVAAQSSEPPSEDWTCEQLELLWGKVNREAARQYQGRLEAIIDENYGAGTEIAYDLKRGAVRVLWEKFRAMILTAGLLEGAGQGVVDFFGTLKDGLKDLIWKKKQK